MPCLLSARSFVRLVVFLASIAAFATFAAPVSVVAEVSAQQRVLLPLILAPAPAPAGVVIDNSKSYAPYEGATYVYTVGEVKNNTPSKVRFVKITATARDATGNSVGTAYGYALVEVIAPAGLSPFRVIISNVQSWSTVDLKVEWSNTTATWWPLEVSNVQSGFSFGDDFRVTGTVRNQYSVTRTDIDVIVTMYDANDDVIGVDWWFPSPASLAAGAQANFEVSVGFWVGRPNHAAVARYAVIAGAD